MISTVGFLFVMITTAAAAAAAAAVAAAIVIITTVYVGESVQYDMVLGGVCIVYQLECKMGSICTP